MSKFDWGDLYWSIWLFGLFLVPELLAVFNVAPWPTFSGTVQHDEQVNPYLAAAIFGFTIGLAFHFRYSIPFFRAEGVGIAVALIVQALI